MAVLVEEEKSNQVVIAAFQANVQALVPLPPAATMVVSVSPVTLPPQANVSVVHVAVSATTVKLQSILKGPNQ